MAETDENRRVSRYDLWVLLHVLAATIWVGGGVTLVVSGISVERRGHPIEAPQLGRLNAWVGPRIFASAGAVAFVAGVLLVEDGPWSWGELWVALGLIGFALTFLPGLLFLSPEARRIAAAMQQHGPTSSEVVRRVRRVLLVSRLIVVVLVLVVADMVLKPTGDDGWVLAVGAVVLVGAVAGVVALGRPSAPRLTAPVAAGSDDR